MPGPALCLCGHFHPATCPCGCTTYQPHCDICDGHGCADCYEDGGNP
ncbi:MAG: hypothetical protein M3Y90_15570 [Actinomycetota bacterium]|nr:hypothetical protein [Actinomycetota bacterium]